MRVLAFGFVFMAAVYSAQTDSVYFGKSPEAPPAPKKQSWTESPWLRKFTYGGNFQAWIGNPTFLFISPTIGFSPVDKLNLGIGGIYNYTSVDYGPYGKFSQSIFGAHSYVRYLLTNTIFVQTQFDKLRQPNWISVIPGEKTWVNYLMAGGGMRQPVSDKGAIMMSLMYNLTPSPLSIYPSRLIVQIGFVSGF